VSAHPPPERGIVGGVAKSSGIRPRLLNRKVVQPFDGD